MIISTGALAKAIGAAAFLLLAEGQVCDLTEQGTSFQFQDPAYADCEFLVFHPAFESVMLDLDEPKIELRLESDENIFHEGPVLFEDKLFFTTNRLGDTSLGPRWGETAPAQLNQFIDIYEWDLSSDQPTVVNPGPDEIPMANGMTYTADGKKILAISQGFNTTGPAIYELDPDTYETKLVLNSFYGTPFNSLNDIKVTEDNIMFFTDPVYGFEQGFRAGNPQLGTNVYRYDANTKTLNIISTEFQRPNGLALVDDRDNEKGGCTLFVTDSGFEAGFQAPRGFDGWGDSALYILRDEEGCFEPGNGPWPAQPLAPVVRGIQDGILVHSTTETLLYCDGNGLWVWSLPLLQPLGLVQQGCTQLMFLQKDGVETVYILAEDRLYSTQLNFDPIALADALEVKPNLEPVEIADKDETMVDDDSAGAHGTTKLYAVLSVWFSMVALFL